MDFSHQVRQELTGRLIPFWQNMRDDEHGGYWGRMDFQLQVHKQADKGCILNSRILWFFSSAYLLLRDPALLDHARHAYRFLTDRCLDREQGGVYWAVTYDGGVADDAKHTYNQAFAVYALAAYYRASGDRQALETARELFRLIEDRCADERGYLEAFTRDWQPAGNEKLSENGVMASRTMNTLLHVFEGYAGLYEAEADPRVGERMGWILELFSAKIYNPARRRQEVFFDLDYRSLIDLHSYGHDIESAWLLDWGAGLLQDPALTRRVSALTDALAEETLARAFRDRSLLNERENGVDDPTRVWWVQAEGVVGFLNAWQKHPQRPEYRRAAEEVWGFIRERMTDPRPGGEWYWQVDQEGRPAPKDIVEPWKCPYHNGRMCIEVLNRLTQ